MITDEQMQVIKMIEQNLEMRFEGSTMNEAREFISQNIKKSKEVSDHYKQLLRSHYGGYKYIWELLKHPMRRGGK